MGEGQLIDKCILLAPPVYIIYSMEQAVSPVLALLLAVVFAASGFYFEGKKFLSFMSVLFFISCILIPLMVFFLPVLYYDCFRKKLKWPFFGIFFLLILRKDSLWTLTGILVMMIFLSAYLSVKTLRMESIREELLRQRDSSTEVALNLKEKNKSLIEKQDYEIYLATLKERNRIAREIHDNVGHILSRCLLQIGALLTVEKTGSVYENLMGMKDTLNEAMDTIRNSVHDLHNDAIDLKQAVEEATSEIKKICNLELEYDMSRDVPRSIKYCFISITKEAMSNVVKHSNGDRVAIVLREHPGFYQLIIEDNGNLRDNGYTSGIGLENMRERVEALNGTFCVYRENGFHIFISIRKEDSYDKGSSC